MAHKLTYYTETSLFTMLLHSITHITDTLTRQCGLNTQIKRLLGYTKKSFHLFGNFTYTERVARVSIISVQQSPTINRDDITFFKWLIIGNAMNYTIIHRSTDCSRKWAAIRIGESFKRRNCTVVSYKLVSNPIQSGSSHARFNCPTYLGQRFGYQLICCTKQFYFIFCLKKYHLR